jgi:hypothetical protein
MVAVGSAVIFVIHQSPCQPEVSKIRINCTYGTRVIQITTRPGSVNVRVEARMNFERWSWALTTHRISRLGTLNFLWISLTDPGIKLEQTYR